MKSIDLIILSVLSCTVQVTQAEGITAKYNNQKVSVNSVDTIKNNVNVTEQSPDTGALWYYIKSAQTNLAQQEFLQLKNIYRSWQPQKALVQALERLSNPQPIKKKAIATKAESKKAPSIFNKIAQQGSNDWITMTLETFNKASKLALHENNIDNNNLMGWVSIKRKAYLKAIEHFNAVNSKTTTNQSAKDGILSALSGLIKQAIHNNDKDALNALIHDYPQQPVSKQIESQAWAYHDQNELQKSLEWFDFTNNYDAKIIILEKLNRKNEAFKLACEHHSKESLRSYCINAYAAKQLSAFNKKEYQSSIEAAENIEQYQTLTNDQLKLYAWSQYHLSHKEKSIEIFKKLIIEDPENKTYANILVNLLAEDSLALNQLAEQHSHIASELNNKAKQSAWDRKQFDLYNDLDDKDKAEEQLTIEAGFSSRNQYSQDALANLDTLDYFIGLSKYWDQYRYGIRVNYQTTESDPLDGYLNTASATELKGYIKHQNNNFNIFAELEYGMQSDDLTSVISGKLSAVWFTSPKLITAGTLYRDRIEDSILSFMGTYDEAERRGAVTATGARGLISYTFKPNWSAGVGINSALLNGEQVEDNSKVAAQLSLTRSLPHLYKEQLDYLRVGPSLSWMSYDKDLSNYDDDNGGYFSPEQYINLGGSASLLTHENKKWQLRSQLGLGYYWVNESDQKSSDKGIGGQLLIEGQWLISAHWEVAGLISSNYAADYNETKVGINIRWNFEGKSGLTSDTLISSSPYNANYAWY